MTSDEKWQHIVGLDDKYLMGGMVLSEHTSFLVRDVDTAFCYGANLSTILASQAAIECHLRYEYCEPTSRLKLGFYELFEQSPLDKSLKKELHQLRRHRNQWVHVNDPHDDIDLLERTNAVEGELELAAFQAIDLLRRVIYREQFV
jgi:hypothetical protein